LKNRRNLSFQATKAGILALIAVSVVLSEIPTNAARIQTPARVHRSYVPSFHQNSLNLITPHWPQSRCFVILCGWIHLKIIYPSSQTIRDRRRATILLNWSRTYQ